MAEKILSTPGVNETRYFIEPADMADYGGACAMWMILNSDKVTAPGYGSPPSTTDLESLYSYAVARNAMDPGDWKINPDGLRITLNDKDTAPGRAAFNFDEHSYESTTSMMPQKDANDKIIYTIQQWEVAPAVMIG